MEGDGEECREFEGEDNGGEFESDNGRGNRLLIRWDRVHFGPILFAFALSTVCPEIQIVIYINLQCESYTESPFSKHQTVDVLGIELGAFHDENDQRMMDLSLYRIHRYHVHLHCFYPDRVHHRDIFGFDTIGVRLVIFCSTQLVIEQI